MNIKELTDKIVADGVLSQEEYRLFMDHVDADGITDSEEEQQIRRILKMIQRKELKVITPKGTPLQKD
ncbi:hypothetical protein KKF84_16285 [Myxococcota bacterium]|nr:hypothetical protein [Myxococcota bacterium]MBU1536884.1 hypothetical protein [Myxococcota bacterium]